MDGDAAAVAAWETAMFPASPEESAVPAIGQRLGVPYLRTQQETVVVHVGAAASLMLHQCSLGLTAISGVVWDCGLLMVDYLTWESEHVTHEHLSRNNNFLDLGTGTGICGLSALLLGASFVLFTDASEPPSFEDNVNQLAPALRGRAQFIAHDWSAADMDAAILGPAGGDWDTVLCSDLLYDHKAHGSLLRVLRAVPFRRAVFAYKKRHDEAERTFFRDLSGVCHLRVTHPHAFPLRNLQSASTPGLFIVVATKV